MEEQKFKKGIFSLGTNFGELAQIMIKKKYGYTDSASKYYDLLDGDTRIEVKFSRALKKEDALNEDNVLALCEKASEAIRSIKSEDAETEKFDCNIQQIKTKEFDVLIYGVFFEDCIEIYTAKKSQIKRMPNYSKKQHKGNKGEGQFHIKNTNIVYHRTKRFLERITYKQLYDILKSK